MFPQVSPILRSPLDIQTLTTVLYTDINPLSVFIFNLFMRHILNNYVFIWVYEIKCDKSWLVYVKFVLVVLTTLLLKLPNFCLKAYLVLALNASNCTNRLLRNVSSEQIMVYSLKPLLWSYSIHYSWIRLCIWLLDYVHVLWNWFTNF